MKRFVYFAIFAIFTSGLTSCTPSPPANTTEMIQPGGRIGNMTVEQGSRSTPYPEILKYCESRPFKTEPAVFIIECTVPPVPGLALVIGWGATKDMLAANWEIMTWEMYIDGYPIDLDRFDWVESTPPYPSPGVRVRDWYIHLLNPTLGEHTFRYLWSSDIPVDDGMDVYQPGTYEHVFSFTVAEP